MTYRTKYKRKARLDRLKVGESVLVNSAYPRCYVWQWNQKGCGEFAYESVFEVAGNTYRVTRIK